MLRGDAAGENNTRGVGNMIRWLYLFQYPDGIPKEVGERWYLGTHVREASQMADYGLVGYRTWNGLKTPYADPYRTVERLNQWDRVTELVFPDFEAFRRATTDHAVTYTPPPYGGPGFLAQTIFISDTPEYDFLRGLPDVR